MGSIPAVDDVGSDVDPGGEPSALVGASEPEPCPSEDEGTEVAMEEKLRFAIREGGRTVGAGVVTKIVE